jgi:hypothetical protein
MALRGCSRGCRVPDCSKLPTLTAEFLDLRSRRLSLIGKTEIIFDRVDAVHQPGTNDERWFDPEYRITPQIFIPIQEEMRDKGAISRRADHEVNMCRPERMAPHRREQLAGGTVIGNGIAHRHDGSEAIGTGRVSTKAGSQVTAGLIFVLNVVELIGRGLPNLDKRVRDRPSLGVRNAATHLQRVARLFPQKNALACRKLSLLSSVERT